MPEKAPIFEKVYQDYVAAVGSLDLPSLAPMLGATMNGDELEVKLFDQIFAVSGAGVRGPDGERPNHSTSVVLAKYLLTCPDREPVDAEWVTYKDFKDALPYAEGFENTVHKPLVEFFSGRLAGLRESCEQLSAVPLDMEVNADLAVRCEGLPKIPLALVFYDEDEDFPAGCSVLFQRSAASYLDMECIAILGALFRVRLIEKAQTGPAPESEKFLHAF